MYTKWQNLHFHRKKNNNDLFQSQHLQIWELLIPEPAQASVPKGAELPKLSPSMRSSSSMPLPQQPQRSSHDHGDLLWCLGSHVAATEEEQESWGSQGSWQWVFLSDIGGVKITILPKKWRKTEIKGMSLWLFTSVHQESLYIIGPCSTGLIWIVYDVPSGNLT